MADPVVLSLGTGSGGTNSLLAKLEAGALDVDIEFENIFEVDGTFFSSLNDFPWRDISDSSSLETALEGNTTVYNSILDVLYCCETSYNFSILDDGTIEALSRTDSDGYTVERASGVNAKIELVTAIASSNVTVAYKAEFAEIFQSGSYEIQTGANKFQLNILWPPHVNPFTQQTTITGLVLPIRISYEYDVNVKAIATGGVPNVDYDVVQNNQGDTIGVSVSVDDSFFEFVIPEIPVASFNNVPGEFFDWDGSSGTPVSNIDVTFECFDGPVQTSEDFTTGNIYLYCVSYAKARGTENDVVVLPQVLSIDPVVQGENASPSLKAWWMGNWW